MLRAILFDAVGTLIYPEPAVAEAYYRVGRELGSARSIVEIKGLFRAAYQRSESLFALPGDGSGLARQPTSQERERLRWRQVVGEVFADLSLSAADAALDRLWQHFAEPTHWRLYDDVATVWSELSARGYTLGIASNFDDRLERICAALPPLDQCRHLFISSRIGFPKPSPWFFRAVEQSLNMRPDEILLVGDDHTNDVLGATESGWQVQWLQRGQMREPGVIGSLTELADRIRLSES